MNFTNEISSIEVGDKVEVKRHGKVEIATVAYSGKVHFTTSNNDFLGLILKNPSGKNNGKVQGKEYFKCKNNYGVFVRSSTVKKKIVVGAEDNSEKKNDDSMVENVDTFPVASEGEMLVNFKENLRISKYGADSSTTAYTSRTSASKISSWTKEERVVGRRKNKIKGKKGFLIYNKVVGEADGGKELTVDEFEKLKDLYSESWKNRLYVYWLRTKPSRRDCRRIRPQNKCHCGHTFKSHEWWDEKNRKGKCRVPGCECECYEYLHYQGSMGFNCKCKHGATSHRKNGKPSECTEKGCPCTGFKTTFSCSCGYPHSAHVCTFYRT